MPPNFVAKKISPTKKLDAENQQVMNVIFTRFSQNFLRADNQRVMRLDARNL